MRFFKCASNTARLSKGGLGFSFGVLKGLCYLGIGWNGWLTGKGLGAIDFLNQFYPGYNPTFIGGILGSIYGFIGGFVLGGIVAALYNVYVNFCRTNGI